MRSGICCRVASIRTSAMRKAFLATLIVLGGARLSAQPGPQTPTVAFSAHTLTIGGVTRGGQVVVFGVGLRAGGYYSTIFRFSGVAEDTDRDGVVTVDVQKGIPPQTIWCLADLTTGQYVVATPTGAPLPRVA